MNFMFSEFYNYGPLRGVDGMRMNAHGFTVDVVLAGFLVPAERKGLRR